MLARLRLRPGGLIARHVNRRFSTRWTYWLLKTPLTPDQITTIAGLMAIVAAGILSFPGWIYGVLGALLMQISSILDGCDGEVARIRYQQTEFGKWYDSAWDEVVNALFLVALGMHVASTEGPAWNGARWLGAFSGLATFLYGAANFHCKWVHGIGLYWWFDTPPAPRAPDEPPPPTTWWSELKTLTGRDAYLLLILLGAVIGALPWLLIAFTALSAVFFLLLLIHIFVARGKW
ncbi:MAG TPA: CDP-alcohol phosphatidyltransferase family protein [Myxococcota bacterium]|nr:CDP-alcohol phosphatidyltransferase family protein [Myxococcota bacterium]HQK50752.1 CDP-alcohol phosphatidyltransferase family protein [Myxococcota bacterium]